MAAPDILPPKGVRPPIIGPGQTFGTITDRIAGIVLTKHTPIFWVAIVAVAAALFGMLQTAVGYLLVDEVPRLPTVGRLAGPGWPALVGDGDPRDRQLASRRHRGFARWPESKDGEF